MDEILFTFLKLFGIFSLHHPLFAAFSFYSTQITGQLKIKKKGKLLSDGFYKTDLGDRA